MLYELIKKESNFLKKYSNLNELGQIAKIYIGQVTKAESDGFLYLKEQIHLDSNFVIEFAIEDVVRAEQIEQMINHDGQSCPLMKLWIKKGAVGKKVTFFKV